MATTASSDSIVEAVGLTKVFSDFWMRQKAVAVDNIDFQIHRGETFGLLGPNGSGKSTTIKMILGLLHKTRGQLLVLGRDPSDVAVKKRIGYLPEESYMYRFLTPLETLDFYAKLFGLEAAVRRRRSQELLEMVGLAHAANRPVGEFSKGMARRLGIAQALINDPDLLILDEPTSGLDPLGSRQVKDLLLDLGRRGKTILLSSHQLDDVQDVCHRMVILYGGKIRRSGTVEQLLDDTGRTIITTPRLRPETVTRIEALLEQSEHVGIERVAAPRQRLEDLFLQIVEQARAEQVRTSGAQSGGPTAAFLRGETEEGAVLIDALAKDEPRTPAPAAATPAAPAGPAREVLDELVSGEAAAKPAAAKPASSAAPAPAPAAAKPAAPASPASPAAPAKPAAPQRPAPQVDQSVIDDLLGGGGKSP
ncbi:MAG: ABC transporter ATP-binding protein [Phycisphaerales bacterium]